MKPLKLFQTIFTLSKKLIILIKEKLTNNKNTLKDFYNLSIQLNSHNQKPSTLHSQNYAIKTFFKYTKNKPIKNYTKLDIDLAISKMAKHLSPSTIKLILSHIKKIFLLAHKYKAISHNPITHINYPKQHQQKQTSLTQNQIKKLLENAKGELKAFLLFAFFTGARASEILALKPKDIKSSHIKITKNQTRYGLTTPKNGCQRDVFIPKTLKDELLKLKFCGFKNNYFSIYYQFKKLAKSLKIKVSGLHITRHTYASLCVKHNLPLTTIATLLGHKNIEMVSKVYAHHIYSKSDTNILKKMLTFKK